MIYDLFGALLEPHRESTFTLYESKAVIRESDFDAVPTRWPHRSILTIGVKNYVTLAGAQKMREELTHLLQERQSVLSAFGTASEKAMHRPPHAIRKG